MFHIIGAEKKERKSEFVINSYIIVLSFLYSIYSLDCETFPCAFKLGLGLVYGFVILRL